MKCKLMIEVSNLFTVLEMIFRIRSFRYTIEEHLLLTEEKNQDEKKKEERSQKALLVNILK